MSSFLEPPDGDEGRYASFSASTPRAGDDAPHSSAHPASGTNAAAAAAAASSSAVATSGPDAGLSAEFVAQRGALSRLQGAIAIVLQDLGDFRAAAAALEANARRFLASASALVQSTGAAAAVGAPAFAAAAEAHELLLAQVANAATGHTELLLAALKASGAAAAAAGAGGVAALSWKRVFAPLLFWLAGAELLALAMSCGALNANVVQPWLEDRRRERNRDPFGSENGLAIVVGGRVSAPAHAAAAAGAPNGGAAAHTMTPRLEARVRELELARVRELELV
jgi:hypothetical protein